ncbi:phosphoribosylpyrophosphate synthetase [Puia dinghuensis]|uniref:Phosphoribosylpyrophosphate synthetase n=1 Tax=Puia dinghuensis TaxID=1792502 RepID=A0A8J2XSF5_9BACT|nr:phosphoribosylpyrophosphate synthetase [Puia dinghuensis]GGA94897.1 hypothetical protein GCM10011511_17760 [Puia dinghuensis]
MENNDSLGEVLSNLKEKGYKADLNFETDTFALYGGDLDMRLNPEEFHVDEIDRIGNGSHPNNDAIVYAISVSTGVKGVLVDRH